MIRLIARIALHVVLLITLTIALSMLFAGTVRIGQVLP